MRKTVAKTKPVKVELKPKGERINLLICAKEIENTDTIRLKPVPNYLPSISAAIGGYSPEKYIWRIGIALHSTPRYLVAFLYRHHHMNILESSKWSHKLPNILCFLNVVEVSSLVGLSYISSTENYDAHEKLFISFMTCSLLYMLIMNGLGKSCLRPQSSLMECKSLRYKTIFFLINILSIFMAVYFFFRHNWHCEPGVYSLFCLCEYMVVLSNMGFHMTAYWDFYEHIFVITDTFGIYGSLPK
ncbi:Post-GPI attachment to proteins factor 2 [Nymphon striatum]|nr:Post-GPI attachment to proteins factor 2 [Nymphon striatum]